MRVGDTAEVTRTFAASDIEAYADTIQPIFPDQVAIPIPVWLVTHRELHTSKRIRLVYDILAEELPKQGFV